MASRLFWRRVPRRVTCRWWFKRKKTRTKPPRDSSLHDYSSLPVEIEEQILVKVHCIKSIVTCTSVCKSWYALVKSRRFITMHLARQNSNTEYYLCSYFRTLCYSIRYYKSERFENYRGLIFPVERFRVHGCCNGLICYTKLDDVSSDIYLWNPTIRKLKILPRSIYYTDRTAYGFWYDTNSDDYKVAKVSCTAKDISKVEVYSLSSNSWDIITASGPKYTECYFRHNAVHVNGTLYWLTSKYWGSKECILISLNIKSGMFQDTLKWPSEKIKSSYHRDMLGVGSSFLLLRCRYGDEGRAVYVYDESLNEVYRNELAGMRPLGVRNNSDEVLFQKCGTHDPPILVFNIRELKFKDFCPSAKTILQVIPFVESLVLTDDGDSSSTPNA